MAKKIQNDTQVIIIAILAMGLVIGGLFVFDFYQKAKQIEGLEKTELLKVSKERILDFEVVKVGRDQGGDRQVQNIIKYRYVSDKEVPPLAFNGHQEVVSKRTNNSLTFLESIKPINDKYQEEKYISRFYSAPTFERVGDKWYTVETATTTEISFFRQTKLTVLDKAKELLGQEVFAVDYYAGAGDGYVAYSGNATDEDWSIVHSATDGNTLDYLSSTGVIGVYRFAYSDIFRGFLPFNTSAIPSGATISSASLYVYVASKNDTNDTYSNIRLIQTNQSSISALSNSDYNNYTTTAGATDTDLGSISTGSYNSVALNATGLTWIKKSGETANCGGTTGYTCLGLLEGHDVADSAPALPTHAGYNTITIYTSEDTGTSRDPYLSVTYSTIAPANIKIDGGTIKIDGGTVKIN